MTQDVVFDEDDPESDLSVLQVETASTLTGKGKQGLTKLTFCIEHTDRVKYNNSMVCQLDTGSLCNVISDHDPSILFQNGNPKLAQSLVKQGKRV